MKHIVLLPLLLVFSCNNEKGKHVENDESHKEVTEIENKKHQIVNVGDTVKIYHITNSCCPYCMPNKIKLAHLEFVEEKIIQIKKDCFGCDYTAVNIFVAKSKGTDTIRASTLIPTEKCNEYAEGLEEYIVQIE